MYRCPKTKEVGYTTDHCESVCFNEGCSFIKECPVYQLNKKAKDVKNKETKG